MQANRSGRDIRNKANGLTVPSFGLLKQPTEGERFTRQWNVIFWTTAGVLLLVLALCATVKPFRPDQFIYLARSLAHGSLSVDDMPLIYPDYVVWQGHVYLPPGPLPAIVLIPFLPLLDLGLQPEWISILFTFLNVCLLYLVCERIGVIGEERRWGLLLFFGGTVYFGVAATMVSWYFAHIVATTCLLLAILEIVGRGQPKAILVGFLIGLAAATRLSLLFALPFFLSFLRNSAPDAHQGHSLFKRFVRIAELLFGLAVPVSMLLAYNYARFGNALETGYGIDVVGSSWLEQARSYGLFSLVHVPKNLIILLLQGPLPYPSLEAPTLVFPYFQPSPMGMAMFFTSPALLFAFRAKPGDPLVKACWLGVASILIPLLTHYGGGWIQFGFRYSLDFMPFLLLIVARGFPRPLNSLVRSLIVLSVVINLWGTAWLQTWL